VNRDRGSRVDDIHIASTSSRSSPPTSWRRPRRCVPN